MLLIYPNPYHYCLFLKPFTLESITTELPTVDDLSTLRIMHQVSDQSRQKISLISGPSEINFTSIAQVLGDMQLSLLTEECDP